MARLTISLLGPLHVTLDGEPVTAFESDKVRALLAYLAVESDHAHRRETLAGLLWPERPERNARHNLSQALSNLRSVIGDRDATPPFLLVTHQTIQFNRDSDHSLDVAAFAALLSACEAHGHHQLETCEPCIYRLREAVALYRKPFLERFYLGDSQAIEEWALVRREGLQRQVMEALPHMVAYHEQRGEYQDACEFARRQVELEPWDEAAQRRFMRTLALSGQRSAALKQYQVCCHTLADELGVEPARRTTKLFEQIRDGRYERPRSPRRETRTEARDPPRSQPFGLPAWVVVSFLTLVLSLGLVAGFLKLNANQVAIDSSHPSTLAPTIIHAQTAVDSSPGQTGIPQTEYQALVTLHQETGGSGWKEADGWLSDSTPCVWFGVTCGGGSVTELNLPDNNLRGEIPPEIGRLTNLSALNLEFNQLEGSIPPELGGLGNLESLTLIGNSHLGGAIPPELGDLTRLETLFLSNYDGATQLRGPIPPELGNLRELLHLELSYSLVSGPIPPELGNLTNLMSLDLSHNQLSGPIPPELGKLSNLRHLNLCGNSYLSGTVPPELGNLVKLESLYLSNDEGGTQLSGPIPPELGNLRRLRWLVLANSLVSGPIPPELGNLTDLVYLDLVKNPLSGPIPPELGNLVNLRTLSVGEGSNALAGSLPLSLMNLKKLMYFTYSSNTDLCEPRDAAFQEWISSIPEFCCTRVLCEGEE